MRASFADRLLAWFERHGRHDLPWQSGQTPYRVWVSEIMLQQTQVITVIPYYRRFMQRFPDVRALAAAPPDAVLAHWSGLGYYARARNLHQAAGRVVADFKGEFPRVFADLIALPGVGRSTAGAILALACDRRYPILDGNVKRVLARYHAVAGWPGNKVVENRLWDYAEQHTPARDFAAYTQAIMDLGATICVRRRPRCAQCPLQADCAARLSGQQHALPESKPPRQRPRRQTIFAILEDKQGQVMLEHRPPAGIWGGLWCFPELESNAAVAEEVRKKYGCHIKETIEHEPLEHTFTHFHLQIRPLRLKITAANGRINDSAAFTWLKPGTNPNCGLPAPVAALLRGLAGD